MRQGASLDNKYQETLGLRYVFPTRTALGFGPDCSVRSLTYLCLASRPKATLPITPKLRISIELRKAGHSVRMPGWGGNRGQVEIRSLCVTQSDPDVRPRLILGRRRIVCEVLDKLSSPSAQAHLREGRHFGK